MKFNALLATIFVIAFVFVFSTKSYACSCIALDQPIKTQVRSARDGASSVFAGEVLEITPSADRMSVSVRIRVETVWKGNKTSEMIIRTAADSAMCGYTFTVGQKYLIYTYKEGDSEGTTNCSRTTLLAGAKKDIKYLGKKIKK